VLLIVDEAQNLSLRVLEEVRMLSGVETTREKVLRIILAGQPELNAKLDSPELIQLAQRVRLRFHLTALSEADLTAYVLHRLEVAGSGGRKIFGEDVFPLLYRYTGGVPRLVNTLCETAMVSAFTSDRDFVTVDDVKSALEELQWPDFAERRRLMDRAMAATTGAYDRTSTGVLAEEMAPRRGPGLYIGPGDGQRGQGAEQELAKLLVVSDGQTVGELPLRLGRTVIGRTPDNDLQIDNRFVSRHHCQIVTTAGNCVIEDLNSTNGILVKSKRVRIHNLNDGDVVTIGKHDLIYIDERGASTHTPVAADATQEHGSTQIVAPG
jgi:general secretion pathway protein A